MFSHEIVPDYLRTKPDPEVEEQEKQLSAEGVRIGPELAQVCYYHLKDMCVLQQQRQWCLLII